MEILILLIIWTSVGLVYFINLCASDAYKNLSEDGLKALCIIFLPTTMLIWIISLIKDFYDYIKRLRNDKRKM